jgi:hypothetical protein
MKWKFWYYIAPAYPAFALFIATAIHDFARRWIEKPAFARRVFYIGASWILIAAVFPVRLHRERVPEVMEFKNAIAGSSIPGPVWFLHDQADHNMIGTSGNWYFNRVVEKVTPEAEAAWARETLRAPAWIITGADFLPTCEAAWCRRAKLVQSTDRSALLLYSN